LILTSLLLLLLVQLFSALAGKPSLRVPEGVDEPRRFPAR
jgi:hypothetical protein